ncbi:uncharacterized protein Dana_GF27272 [Drosophila ananassae]|uniref:Uncharacterized protein n=1 Tax=Drosophila ananassae TaxID=7217 RepID=A0A0P8YFG4_DROAN|nr:uncharacterized protein Dana_GF27272 [Drosophila ananassae]
MISDSEVPQLGEINICEIKAIDRYHNMINIEGRLKKNISQIEVHAKLLKRESGGWHPFFYNVKVDVCKFLKSPRSLFIPKLMYSFVKAYTNVNHTCPYLEGSVLRLWNWTPSEDGVIAIFPVDYGQYGLHSNVYSNKVLVMQINGSVLFFK